MAKREETLQMAILYLQHGMSPRQIGEQYGISRQTVSQRLAALEIERPAPPPRYQQIDKTRLEFLYLEKSLAVYKLAKTLRTAPKVIRLALEFHKIPLRKLGKPNGKHINLLRELKVGSKIQIECLSNQPYSVLHASAKRAGIKISVKSFGGGRFVVTRLD